jgi:hypothetical protein
LNIIIKKDLQDSLRLIFGTYVSLNTSGGDRRRKEEGGRGNAEVGRQSFEFRIGRADDRRYIFGFRCPPSAFQAMEGRQRCRRPSKRQLDRKRNPLLIPFGKGEDDFFWKRKTVYRCCGSGFQPRLYRQVHHLSSWLKTTPSEGFCPLVVNKAAGCPFHQRLS